MELIVDLRRYGYDARPTHVWESIRGFIKQSEYGNIYYNRIPSIMHMMGLRMRIDVKNNHAFIKSIVDEFRVVNARFDRLEDKPKYFPNMRFIALKFLHDFGAKFDFDIPLIRTKRKLKPLEIIWNSIKLPQKKYDEGSVNSVATRVDGELGSIL